MKKHKKSKKDVMDNYLELLENDLKKLDDGLVKKDSRYIASFKMYTDTKEMLWDVTSLVDLVRFESRDLLVKLLRSIHHDYSIMNIQEMTAALNGKKQCIEDYSEDIPLQLIILKELADSIEKIHPVNN